MAVVERAVQSERVAELEELNRPHRQRRQKKSGGETEQRPRILPDIEGEDRAGRRRDEITLLAEPETASEHDSGGEVAPGPAQQQRRQRKDQRERHLPEHPGIEEQRRAEEQRRRKEQLPVAGESGGTPEHEGEHQGQQRPCNRPEEESGLSEAAVKGSGEPREDIGIDREDLPPVVLEVEEAVREETVFRIQRRRRILHGRGAVIDQIAHHQIAVAVVGDPGGAGFEQRGLEEQRGQGEPEDPPGCAAVRGSAVVPLLHNRRPSASSFSSA